MKITLQDIVGLHALRCSILESKEFKAQNVFGSSECSALLVDLENPNLGPVEVTEHLATSVYILVVNRLHRKGEDVYVRAYPLRLINGERQVDDSCSASGLFLTTTDSRFSDSVCKYPISIHSRLEV